MIRNICKTFKLMRYAHNLYIYIILMFLFALIGISFILISPTGMGTFIAFIVLALLAPIQCLYDFLFSGLVKSAPMSRSMELGISNFFSSIATLISYILILIVSLHQHSPVPDQVGECAANIFYSGLAVAVTLLYFSACYKSFILSTLGFALGYMIVNISMNVNFFSYPASLSIQQAATWGITFVLFGIALSCIIRVLLYKKPLSSKAMGSSLRKHM